MAREGILLGYGNPLLDICINADETFLEKYDLKADDAILAEDKHKPMYDEMVTNYAVTYVAGGATLNTIRVAQWLLEKPKATTFFGCISDDKFGRILVEECQKDGVNVKYQYTDRDSTGTCGVVITGKHRSLCANLAAANLFTVDHLDEPENSALIEQAAFYYICAYPLTACPDAVLNIAQHSHNKGKTFCMNLSAPFLIQFFKEAMMKVFPYIDLLFCNETEAATMAKEHNFGTEDMKEIAVKMTDLPKVNTSTPRMVVITQGLAPTYIAHEGKVTEYPVIAINDDDIVDTNGAGDAFAGGFLSQFVLGRPVEDCVRCGHYAAHLVIQNSGCTYPEKADFK